ncbi:MAG: 2-oxoglutarate dehydrogenase complex dihydrolipoyllysine-residue succinyltransferase [Planctomycetota bacterium]|jgi:2-oxoglutarate dehydrogenase E2 component (dihydrolipoamide succinyltransferase)
MPIQITIPSPGESVTEVVLGPWKKSSGQWVEKDESLVEIESDKVTLEVPAPESGLLTINAEEGEERVVGDVIGAIDPDADRPAADAAPAAAEPATADAAKAPAAAPATATAPAATAVAPIAADNGVSGVRASSVARAVAADTGVDLARIAGTGPSGRITKEDVLRAAVAMAGAGGGMPAAGGGATGGEPARGVRREKMSKLRQRIAERLVMAQHQAAMLTTFNEVDMTAVMALRKRYKEDFAETHGVGLGFMGFFVKAVTSALQAYPGINAYIVDGREVEYHDFCDVSVAVGTPKGLVVPVIRNAERMSFAEVESTIKDLAIRARDGQLTIDEMTGGTFTISNGGVYGSLCSTPILNPPQSGILGMHKIMSVPREHPDRPGEIALRPMMQLALSYDHRIVDGEQAVRFLVHVKDRIERPDRLMLEI